MDNLDDAQRRAVAHFRDLTNGGDDDVAIAVLESVDWDVQKAAEMVFGPGSYKNTPISASRTPMESFELDDSEQTGLLNTRPPAPAIPQYRPSVLLSVLTYPIHILGSIFRFVFSILRIPVPRIPFLSLTFYRPGVQRTSSSSIGGPEKWIRELEEETGASCIGSATQGVSSGMDAGPSSLSSRNPTSTDRYLPNFTSESYEAALRRAKKETKVLCVVLVSEEHDDVAEFKRKTLTDSTFVHLLTDNDFIVWGGDVRHKDAYSTSEKLQATTYPFVAFVSLQPSRDMSSSRSPTMTVLSRHQGALGTTPEVLNEHLTINLIPRVKPFLQSLRNSQLALESERQLRQQQDRAFQDSARRDTERIKMKMDLERRETELRKQREDEEARLAQEDEDRAIAQAIERERLDNEKLQWRRWLRSSMLKPESSSDTLRIAIRLPDGKRLVRKFAPDATMTALYAFVDTHFLPDSLLPEDSVQQPEGDIPKHLWGFKLLNAYPRSDVPWSNSVSLSDVEGLRGGGGQLVVEELSERVSSSSVDDGYITESDEE